MYLQAFNYSFKFRFGPAQIAKEITILLTYQIFYINFPKMATLLDSSNF